VRVPIALVALAAWVPVAVTAQAPTDARGLWSAGRAHEEAAEPAEALARYRELTERFPHDRLSTRARRRVEYLSLRSEGEFGPLGALMRAQRDPSPAAITDLERRLSSFPEGLVRLEARALVAASWLRLERPARSEAAYRALLAEEALSGEERARARTGLARALERGGDPAAAMEVLAEGGQAQGPLAAAIAREGRTRIGRPIALVLIVLFLALVAWRTRGALFEGLRPRHALFAMWLLAVPALVAATYDPEAMDTFALLAVASLPGLLGAYALGRRARSEGGRWGMAVAAVAAQVAVGYLVLVERGAVLGVSP
jgi:hypothetical protein